MASFYVRDYYDYLEEAMYMSVAELDKEVKDDE